MSDSPKVRKPRTPRTLAERREAIRKAEAGLAWDAAKDLFSNSPTLKILAEGKARISKIVRECESFNSPERIEEMRARLMARLASLDARAKIAQVAGPRFRSALNSIDAVFISAGKAVMAAQDNGTDLDPQVLISSILPNDARNELLALAGDDSDPFAEYRRKNSPGDPDAMPDDSEEEDSDETDSE